MDYDVLHVRLAVPDVLLEPAGEIVCLSEIGMRWYDY
jgi:hypothetical protein